MNRIPFTGSTAPEGFQFSSERNVNWYTEDQTKLAQTPGLTLWNYLNNGPIRGGCLHKEDLIVVSGAIVYLINPNGSARAIGTIQSRKGRIELISNGVQVLVLDTNGDGYTWDGTGLNKMTDPDWIALKPTTMQFHDGYAVANKINTGQVYISSLYDFTAWAPLDFATAEAKPDDVVEIVSDKNLLWIFGTRTLEVWQNTGNSDFPFEPLRSAFSYYGAYANTVERLDNTLVWFGRNENGGKCILRLTDAANPTMVSDNRLNEWFDSLSLEDINKAFSHSLWYRGHSWYCLTFPDWDDFGKTIVYDASTGVFFEWSTYCDSDDAHGRFRAEWQISFAGANLIGDYLSGTLYKLDGNAYLDAGQPIKRTRRLDTMGKDMDYVTWATLQLELETGDGTPGQDYTMELKYSQDRGRSWSHSKTKSIGEGGEYSKRVVWRRNGRSRRQTWEINTTAAKDIRINSGYLEVAA